MAQQQEREHWLALIKKGNKSSAIAMLGNAVIAAAKGVGAALSGSGAMFASAMHSLADCVNQGFVFAGSVLAERKPNRKFPTGFGRVINIFCMVAVAFRVGYDNMVGLIGVAAPRDVAEKVSSIILSDQDVTDINGLRIIQEGRYYHVDTMIELRSGLSLADADDIKFRVQDQLSSDPDISDVVLGIIEDNGVKNWTPEHLNEFS